MTPVDALKMNRAVDRIRREMAEYGLQERCKFGRGHLSRRHRKFAVPDRAKAAYVPGNRHVVGRVGEYELGALLAKQGLIGLGSGRIAANQPMAADAPKVTRPGDGRAGADLNSRICRVVNPDRVCSRRMIKRTGAPLPTFQCQKCSVVVQVDKAASTT